MGNPLGFTWDRAAIAEALGALTVHSAERAVWRYRRLMPEFVWDAARLEGNPFTYPEVQTLMEGVTVGGHKVSDERQVLALADSSRELLDLATSGRFVLDKATSDRLHVIIARDEALESGAFRGEGKITLTPGVSLGEHGRFLPPATEPGGANLRELYANGVAWLHEELTTVTEQAIAGIWVSRPGDQLPLSSDLSIRPDVRFACSSFGTRHDERSSGRRRQRLVQGPRRVDQS